MEELLQLYTEYCRADGLDDGYDNLLCIRAKSSLDFAVPFELFLYLFLYPLWPDLKTVWVDSVQVVYIFRNPLSFSIHW